MVCLRGDSALVGGNWPDTTGNPRSPGPQSLIRWFIARLTSSDGTQNKHHTECLKLILGSQKPALLTLTLNLLPSCSPSLQLLGSSRLGAEKTAPLSMCLGRILQRGCCRATAARTICLGSILRMIALAGVGWAGRVSSFFSSCATYSWMS